MTKADTNLALLALAGVGIAAWFVMRPRDAQAAPRQPQGAIYGTGTALREPVPYAPEPAPSAGGWIAEQWNKLTTAITGSGDYTAPDVSGRHAVERTPAEWRAVLQPIFRRVEKSYAMPSGLLEAIADRESRFRHDIISCQTLGSAGEEGIMQLKPQFHLGSRAERCNPEIAIPYAGLYLAKNYRRFGFSWDMAIIAYTWGPTDLENKGLQAAPADKKAYLAWVHERPYVEAFA